MLRANCLLYKITRDKTYLTEAQRIANLTGNKPVVIARSPGTNIKLPGL